MECFLFLKGFVLLVEGNCFLFLKKILYVGGRECRGGGKLYLLGYKGCGCIVVKGVLKGLLRFDWSIKEKEFAV